MLVLCVCARVAAELERQTKSTSTHEMTMARSGGCTVLKLLNTHAIDSDDDDTDDNGSVLQSTTFKIKSTIKQVFPSNRRSRGFLLIVSLIRL